MPLSGTLTGIGRPIGLNMCSASFREPPEPPADETEAQWVDDHLNQLPEPAATLEVAAMLTALLADARPRVAAAALAGIGRLLIPRVQQIRRNAWAASFSRAATWCSGQRRGAAAWHGLCDWGQPGGPDFRQ